MSKKKKVIIDELIEQEKELTMIEWLYMKIDDVFVENIPLDPIKQLPNHYKYFFGSIAHIFSLTILIGFLIWGYDQAINKSFISLHSSDGICNEIPLSVTGTYRADIHGVWEGSKDFQAPLAPYYLYLIDLRADTKTYHSLMSSVHQQLIQLGQAAKNQDLATNLIYWMMWSYVLPDPKSTNFFLMTGHPNHVFDRLYYFGVISSAIGECNIDQTVDLMLPDIIMSYHLPSMENNFACIEAINPVKLGYVSFYQGEYLTLDLDIIAITIANAVCHIIIISYYSYLYLR